MEEIVTIAAGWRGSTPAWTPSRPTSSATCPERGFGRLGERTGTIIQPADLMSNTKEPLAEKAEKCGVPAIERALNVLECLSQSRKGYSVSELSRRLALPKSSVHLILRTLERRGYLQKQSSAGATSSG